MRERKLIVRELFELRSKLLLVQDEIVQKRLKEEIEKNRKELIAVSLEDAKNKKGRLK